ncbi:MAG: diaminohydroxyphosphoribosylaminopyrimidine deaminase, partial [Frankiales bacterium]|nr:diaminohydroxyphosphoribosylaminopyrimidine deaminase [Frankiales bacterium]
DGSSRWITGEAARADVHRLRAQTDAIVVGVGTVLADDPSLTSRPALASTPAGHQPLRVVLDPKGRTPSSAAVLDGAARTLVVTNGPSYGDERTLVLDGDRVDLEQLLAELGERGVVSVLLEGGPTLAGAFLRAGLVDRVIGYIAPALLGAGPQAVLDAGVGTIDDAIRLQLDDVTRLGDDLRLTLSLARRD